MIVCILVCTSTNRVYISLHIDASSLIASSNPPILTVLEISFRAYSAWDRRACSATSSEPQDLRSSRHDGMQRKDETGQRYDIQISESTSKLPSMANIMLIAFAHHSSLVLNEFPPACLEGLRGLLFVGVLLLGSRFSFQSSSTSSLRLSQSIISSSQSPSKASYALV